jgi:DNA-directed RNA polymerase subunit H (RpoH/RPB5)
MATLWMIYNNVLEYIEYRGLSCKTTLNEATFNKEMSLNHYIIITCGQTIIILARPSAMVGRRSADFIKTITPHKNKEIIFITNEVVRAKLVERVVLDGFNLRSLSYNTFIINITRAPMVPRHVIVDPTDIELILNNIGYEAINLPKILYSDPQSIWLGAKVGDIVKTTAYNEQTGTATNYRIVVR